MQTELQKSTEKTLTSEERAQQMDQLLAGEEERVAQLEKELARLRERQVIGGGGGGGEFLLSSLWGCILFLVKDTPEKNCC